MRRLGRNRHAGSRLAAVALACMLAGSLRAETGPLERLDQAMLEIGAHIHNAKVRLKKGVFAANPAGDVAPPAPTETVALRCCQNNVETIRRGLQTVHGILGELHGYYDARQNSTGSALVEQMVARWRQMAEGMLLFIRAPSAQRAGQVLEGLIRPWNELRNGMQALEGCCPVLTPPPTAAAPEAVPEKTKEKGKERKPKSGDPMK